MAAPSLLTVQFDPARLEKARAELAGGKTWFRRATYSAVSRTTRAVASLVNDTVRRKTTISKKYVDRVILVRVSDSAEGVAEGHIKISQEPLPAVAYKHSPSTPGKRRKGGVKVQIYKDKPAITFKHAFLANVKSGAQRAGGLAGHVGIFLRRKLPEVSQEELSAALASGQGLAGIGRRLNAKRAKSGYAARLPIDEMRGPSVLNVVTIPEILKEITIDANARLHRELDGQVNRFLKRTKLEAAAAST